MITNRSTIDMERAANVLKLLGDKTRLTMMRILSEQDCCVCEFVEIFQASQPAISQHIRKLKDVGLVRESRRGQWIIYSLNEDYEYLPFVKGLLEALPSQEYRLIELEKQGKRISCE
ncbi:ArsR/SmtB family transcription factor [Cytobacillus sp. FJAT-54145]|uniref:ArsR/SmtB family transcription factor n=1 Tax=Cytobacillus spartinae TaxID=3299023 RepID=A0ABW6KHU3_9BACI